ncbi:MAG: patatin-like phospholipase family protein [Cyanobacteria bacterium P01_A01_bin.45]
MPFRILSLDGGGIRGVMAATMLATIEKQIQQPLNEYFDLIAGASTGSILAAAIATGRSSERIIELYRNKSSIIFPYQSRLSPRRLGLILRHGISAPKFSSTGLIEVLREVLGETTIFDVLSPLLLILAYDTIERQPIVFKNWRQDKGYGNIPLWETCVSSASAPTYFPAHKLDKKIHGKVHNATSATINFDENASSSKDIYTDAIVRITSGLGGGQTRKIRRYVGRDRQAIIDSPWKEIPDTTSTYSITTIFSAIDGGVVANNPSTCAVAEALKLGYSLDDITVLSIGTGDRTRVIPYDRARHWGLLQWAQPIVGVVLDGSQDVSEYITEQMLHKRLLRLQFKLDRELIDRKLSDEIDDVSEENINNLIAASEIYLEQPKIKSALQEFLSLNQDS